MNEVVDELARQYPAALFVKVGGWMDAPGEPSEALISS